MKATNLKSLHAILVLLVAMVCTAAQVRATVEIMAQYGVGDYNEVVISYDARTEAELPRAFSLNIHLTDANIISVGNVNPDFPIHPGTINIDLSGPNPVIDYGTQVAPLADLPSDTLFGLGTNGITIEMASLYAPTGPGSPNTPDPCGPLLSIYVDGDCCLTFTGNIAHAGNSSVVM